MPSRIVRFIEKHGDFYYDASTDELYRQALATVFRERWEEGYWYSEPSVYLYLSDAEKPYEDLSEEQIDVLPDELKKKALAVHAKKTRAEGEYKRDHAKWRMAKRFYEKDCPPNYTFKSGGHSYYFITMFMSERNEYEYQGHELINLETV